MDDQSVLADQIAHAILAEVLRVVSACMIAAAGMRTVEAGFWPVGAALLGFAAWIMWPAWVEGFIATAIAVAWRA
jgi:hypothetical protein